MIEFQLFRIKIYPPQMHLFKKDKTRPEILKETVFSLPQKELRKNITWRIGNVQELDESSIYFRIGRTFSAKVELYKDGNFLEQNFETAPYTHVLIDFETELCAIAKKTKLSPRTKSIANQFIRLLNKSAVADEIGATFEIKEISDPEDFISHLKKAYSITKFWLTFTRPNAFDANQDFVKPMQKYLEATNADKGKAEIMGNGLDVNNLEELSRSAAATGDDAIAEVKTSEKGKKTRKYLRGKSVTVSVGNFDDIEHKKTIMQTIRDLYNKLRNDESLEINYWKWFFKGSGNLPGYRRIVNQWLFLHLFIGTIIAILTPLPLKECASTVLLPLAGTLVGLAFAWSGNAQALLESEEIEEISQHHPGGFVEYVYTYQTAILTIMAVLVLWGMAGLEVCHQWLQPNIIRGLIIKSFLFMLSSLALRECWHVILGAQWMLISKKEVQKRKVEKK